MGTYSSYRSDPRVIGRSRLSKQPKVHRHGHAIAGFLLAVAIGLAIFVGFQTGSSVPAATAPPLSSNSAVSIIPATAPAADQCADNKLDKFIKVSITQRHLWACQRNKTVYDTPVITGMEKLAADRTPTGVYHVYSKQTNTTLSGKDSTGSWKDPVRYWMPFLDNHYGTYGFHDASWRSDSDFGHVDPNSSQASHGCVELPLGASQWLYGWSRVGTTVGIEN